MANIKRNPDETLDTIGSVTFCNDTGKAHHLHLEQLRDDCWCLIIEDNDGRTMLYLHTKRGAKIIANVVDENLAID